MSSITIRGCCIGAGRPKVILPIVARTEDDILREARRLSALKADCIEWRADWFSDALDAAALKRVLSGLRAALGEKLLLVTFRTKAEGGETSLTPQQYADFCGTVCVSGCADLLDVEFFPNQEELPALIGQAHKAGVAVVCSSHDFHKTPSRTEMVTRLTAMQQVGADLPKLAVMLGAVSRLCGETFGSAMTFANPGQASAPGQVALDVVNEVLDSLSLE